MCTRPEHFCPGHAVIIFHTPPCPVCVYRRQASASTMFVQDPGDSSSQEQQDLWQQRTSKTLAEMRNIHSTIFSAQNTNVHMMATSPLVVGSARHTDVILTSRFVAATPSDAGSSFKSDVSSLTVHLPPGEEPAFIFGELDAQCFASRTAVSFLLQASRTEED
jgi:hypothetical protein